jgi:hypothetical protein
LSTIPKHQWASWLFRFDLSVEYRSGANNVVVDALSHHDIEVAVELCALFVPSFLIFDTLRNELEADQELHTLKEVAAGTKGGD